MTVTSTAPERTTAAQTTAAGQAVPRPAAPRPVVILDQLGKTFGSSRGQSSPGLSRRGQHGRAQNVVLEDVDLTIGQGEFVALLGASGCGKSTLLNLIAGLEAPSKGSLEIPADGVAFMFQDANLFPWLTAQGNIELALELSGVPKAERKAKADELLALVHLQHAGKKRPHELSGGMRQRVALARSLAQDKHVLLMDEPFAALDAITRDLLHEELTRIWKHTGRTIVFVTHNVREAVRLGQRVLLLSSRPGKVIREWQIEASQKQPEQAALLADEMTAALRQEISRHV